MTARVLVIGLDAVESTVLEQLVAEGRCPSLARLGRSGGSVPMRTSCMDSLPGAIWQDIGTGRPAAVHGDFYPLRIHGGESVLRWIDPAMHADDYYWTAAARAGRRVAVVDQPLVPALPSVPEVTLVAEWHVHDQLWGSGSNPPELFAELEAIHGSPAIDRCDAAHQGSLEAYEAWTGELLQRLGTKTAMVEDLLGRDAWDLFTVAFSEGHCAGHQMWHLHDPSWPRHPAGCTERQRGLVEEVYVALDAAIGRLVEAAGTDVTTLVFTSHGMGPYIGGTQLLPDVLTRLGLGDARRIPPWVRPLVPVRTVQQLWRRWPRLRRATSGTVLQQRGFLRPGVKAIAVPNNRVGAIRLNLRGREPAGEVDPADAARLMDDIADELLALRLEGSGERVVAEVVRTAERYGPDRHPDLPDLLVVFRRDLGEVAAVEGPRVGTIRRAIQRPDYPRTGDHTDAARLWFDGPGTEGIGSGPVLSSLDLAPVILGLVGVEAPGRTLPV